MYGKVNSYLTDCDSKHEHIRLRSEAIIAQEVNYAMHLGVGSVVMELPEGTSIENFGRIINQYV